MYKRNTAEGILFALFNAATVVAAVYALQNFQYIFTSLLERIGAFEDITLFTAFFVVLGLGMLGDLIFLTAIVFAAISVLLFFWSVKFIIQGIKSKDAEDYGKKYKKTNFLFAFQSALAFLILLATFAIISLFGFDAAPIGLLIYFAFVLAVLITDFIFIRIQSGDIAERKKNLAKIK
jgi:hypothetical protein